MVGPSYTEEERRLASLRLKLGFVLLVGASGALVALQVDGSLVQLVGGFVGGLVVGVLLLAFLIHWGKEFNPAGRRGR